MRLLIALLALGLTAAAPPAKQTPNTHAQAVSLMRSLGVDDGGSFLVYFCSVVTPAVNGRLGIITIDLDARCAYPRPVAVPETASAFRPHSMLVLSRSYDQRLYAVNAQLVCEVAHLSEHCS